MVLWQRNANARLNNAWDARCVTSYVKGMMKRPDGWRNNVTKVTAVTTNGLSSIGVTTSSGRIASTTIVVTPMTRSKTTKFPMIAVRRRSSHAQCMGPRASTPQRSATRTQKTRKVKFKTGNVPMKCTTMTRDTPAKMMSHTQAWIHQSQVKIQRQNQARARRTTKRRIIISMFQRRWR